MKPTFFGGVLEIFIEPSWGDGRFLRLMDVEVVPVPEIESELT